MTEIKRTKGRPKNTGIDDSKPLREMADLLLSRPAMKPKTAAWQVAPRYLGGISLENVVHRLAAKWRVQSAALLEQARARREESTPVIYVGGHGRGGYMTATEHLAGYQRGHSAARAASGFGYGLGAADTVTAMMRERERMQHLATPPVTETQRITDMIREQSMRYLPQRSLQDEVMDIMRKEEERRRLYERAASGYPFRGY